MATATTPAPITVSAMVLVIAAPLFWRPGLVVAPGGGLRPEEAAGRAIGQRGTGLVRHMRLRPGLAQRGRLGRRLLPGVMQPAVPFGRYPARLGLTVVDDPASASVGRLIVDVAFDIFADT